MRTSLRLLGCALSISAAACGRSSSSAPVTPSRPTTPAPIDSSMMLRTASGLQFRDIVVGRGTLVARGQWISVHYVGQLLNGTQFDASGPNDPPIRFQVGAHRVIAGWDEGVVGMRVGGTRQLIIPPALGYGSRTAGRIPPNSTLVFTIEVVGVD